VFFFKNHSEPNGFDISFDTVAFYTLDNYDLAISSFDVKTRISRRRATLHGPDFLIFLIELFGISLGIPKMPAQP
jgi:hypothetical protein